MGRAHEVRKVAMAKTAAAKAKLYSRYGKEIYLAAKAGGTDPDGNLALRRIIAKAKKEQVPADVIKRAVDKVVELLKIIKKKHLKDTVQVVQLLLLNA